MSYQSARSISLLPTINEAILANRFVSVAATGLLVQTAAAATLIAGVALEASPDSDDAGVDPDQASVAIPVAVPDGAVIEVEVGAGGVTAGDSLTSGADGRAITAAAGNRIHGIALDTGAVGVTIRCILQSAGRAA